MAMADNSELLTHVWAGLIVFIVFLYVVMDGFDLGVGLLFAIVPERGHRDVMMNSLAPVWDGNETWLVLGGGGLFAAFPLAYAVLMPALYPLVIAMLLGLIFRGVAFEFRWRTERGRWVWDSAFIGGSFVAALSQGMILGAIVQGVEVSGREYGGGWWDWATPFSLLTGMAVVCGYLLLGTTWLVMKTDGELQERMRQMAWAFGLGTVGFIVAVSLATLFTDEGQYMGRWLGDATSLAFSALVAITVAGLAVALYRSLSVHRHEYRPFVLSLALFALSFFGLATSMYPYVVPPSLTIFETASPAKSQGGAATLYTAQEAPGYAPELDLVAGIALAPGGVGLSNAPSFVADAEDPPLDAVRFLPILMLGVEAARPDLGAAAMMSDDMTPYMDLARTGCLGDLREAMVEVPASVFRDGVDVGPLVDYLDGQDPMRARPKVPVLVVQGGDDALVARPDTESLVDALCDAGAVMRYELLADADHRGTITGAPGDALDFARAVRDGDEEGMPGEPCT